MLEKIEVNESLHAASAALEVIVGVRYVMEEEELARQLVLVFTLGYGRCVAPHLLESRVDSRAVFLDAEVKLQVYAARGMQRNVVIVLAIEGVSEFVGHDGNCGIEILLVNEYVNVTARAHPALRVEGAHPRTLER